MNDPLEDRAWLDTLSATISYDAAMALCAMAAAISRDRRDLALAIARSTEDTQHPASMAHRAADWLLAHAPEQSGCLTSRLREAERLTELTAEYVGLIVKSPCWRSRELRYIRRGQFVRRCEQVVHNVRS